MNFFDLYINLSQKIKIILLSIFFLLTSRFFEYFPKLSFTREIWIIFVFIFLVLTVLFLKWLKFGFCYRWIEIYILIICLMPVYSAISAYSVFGQPISYGILAQRSLILAGASLLLLYGIEGRIVKYIELERALILLGWASLALMTVIPLVFDPILFYNYKGFVGYNEYLGYYYKINATFVIFTFIYYICKFRKINNYNCLLYSILFLSFIIFKHGGRSLLVALTLCLIIFIFDEKTIKKQFYFSVKIFSGISIFLILIFSYRKEEIFLLIDRFFQVFIVVFQGEVSSDPSANARLIQVLKVMPYIAENPIFGNGDLSYQWQGGYLNKFGYFYPTDIGLIGVLYVFGLFGTIIFLFQFIFAWKGLRALPKNNRGHFFDAIKFYLIYLAFHSVVTGQFAHSVEIGLVFVAILYSSREKFKNGKLYL